MAQVLVRIKKILFIGFVLVINTSCNNYLYNRKELENILGAKVYNYSKQYSYEESAGIQGEGFLINKYLLDNETINLFINNNDIISYPLYDEYKTGWDLINWNKGYVLNSNIITLISVFKNNYDSELQKELEGLMLDIYDKENYISFFYKDSIEDPYSVEIYILNPKTNVFWVVNIST